MFGIASFAQAPFATLGVSEYKFFVFENISLSDNNAVTAALLDTLYEHITVADTNSLGTIFYLAVNEAINNAATQVIGSAYLMALHEPMLSNDTPVISHGQSAFVSENVGVNDALTSYFALQQTITETVDSFADTSAQQSDFLQSLAENIAALDLQNIQAAYINTTLEGITAGEQLVVAAQFFVSHTEDSALQDSYAAGKVFVDSATEVVGVADASNATLVLIMSVIEPTSVASSEIGNAGYPVSRADNIGLSDTITTSGWIKVYDAQSAGWTDVNDNQ